MIAHDAAQAATTTLYIGAGLTILGLALAGYVLLRRLLENFDDG